MLWIVHFWDSFYLLVRNLCYLTLITNELYKCRALHWGILTQVLEWRLSFPLLWEFGVRERRQPEGVHMCCCLSALAEHRLFPHREHDEHAATRQWDTTAPAAGPALCPGQCPAGPDPPDRRGWTGPSSMYPSARVNWRGGSCGAGAGGVGPVSLGFWIPWITWDEGKVPCWSRSS